MVAEFTCGWTLGISMAIELYVMVGVNLMQSYQVLLKGKNGIGCLLGSKVWLIFKVSYL